MEVRDPSSEEILCTSKCPTRAYPYFGWSKSRLRCEPLRAGTFLFMPPRRGRREWDLPTPDKSDLVVDGLPAEVPHDAHGRRGDACQRTTGPRLTLELYRE